jgi:hypothetical protein
VSIEGSRCVIGGVRGESMVVGRWWGGGRNGGDGVCLLRISGVEVVGLKGGMCVRAVWWGEGF